MDSEHGPSGSRRREVGDRGDHGLLVEMTDGTAAVNANYREVERFR